MEIRYLFKNTDWHSTRQTKIKFLDHKINLLESNQILNSTTDDLYDYFISEYALCTPTLDHDSITVGQEEKLIDVTHDQNRYFTTSGPHYLKGTEVCLSIQFTGDSELFYVQPTRHTYSPPRGEILENQLLLKVSGIDLDPIKVRSELNKALEQVENHLSSLTEDVNSYNNQIRASIRQQIEARKSKLLRDQNLISELGFPLKERPDSAKTYPAPTVRKKIKTQLPARDAQSFQPEPALTTDDYEHVLSVLGNMTEVMERSPSAFINIEEESLRSHFLVQLNGHYEGNATGETFNYSGKTDILLRVNGKNIFIGECKFWGGSKKLKETLDQLLSYSSWRDTKVALLIFNRNKNLSSVLSTIPGTIEAHPNYKRTLSIEGETRFRYLISHRDDHAREMVVTVLVFDIPTR